MDPECACEIVNSYLFNFKFTTDKFMTVFDYIPAGNTRGRK
jgi:hypothetical protein